VSGWDGLVVVMGTSWWGGPPLLEQHLARELTRYAPVLYVNPTTSLLSRFRNADAAAFAGRPGLRVRGPRLAILDVAVPPLQTRPVGRQLARVVLREALRRAVRRLGPTRVHAVIAPSLEDVFGAVGEQVSVFYAKDDYVAGAPLAGLDAEWLARSLRRTVQGADAVVAVSPVLAAELEGMGAREPHVIPNGCNPDAFSATAVPPTGTRTVAYVGQLSNRVDVGLLESVAARGVRLKLLGPHQATLRAGAFDSLLGRGNVEAPGLVRYADLPGLLGDVTTCVLPYLDTPFNRASFPLKLLEYLSAGRRVVTTDLPAARWLDTDLVTIADGADFTTAVLDSLALPLSQAEADERKAFATSHSWASRAQQLAQLLDLSGTAS
jgi:teichuronic acid biosynthesis glycosyltransferase TuaH